MLSLIVYGASGQTLEISALVDSGCNETLVLSPELILALRAEYLFDQRIRVASGTITLCPVYQVEIQWGELRRTIHASALGSGREAILGMQLFQGHRIEIDAEVGGEVRITPLSV